MERSPLQPLMDIMEHVVKHKDPILIILKGHLLVEEVMNTILDMSVKNPDALRQARLTFSQRLHLLRALKTETVVEHVFPLIRELNQIRNKLAHNLSPKNINHAILDFTKHASEAAVKNFELEQDLNLRLYLSIMAITAGLEFYFHGTSSRIPIGKTLLEEFRSDSESETEDPR